jgi:hypothetical protein
MNKRERRQLVMARRYERLDQRKQQSKWVKQEYQQQADLWDFIETQDHPLARLACELRDSFMRRDYNRIDTWRQENPEQSAQLAAYMRQLEKDFKNESN